MLANAGAAPAPNPALEGRWGGDRAQLTIEGGAGRLELECAFGSFAGPVPASARGRFELGGRFDRQSPGPQRVEEAPLPPNARYVGELQGQVLMLTVWPGTGEAPLEFKLRKGATVKMVRCF